jgi:type II secretory pathway pseudopilin PulG
MKKAFTLIELLLYITIVGIILTSLVPVAWNVIEGEAKNTYQEEVVSTARNTMERIKYEIRNASSITSVAANSLVLVNRFGATVTIDLSGTKVRINAVNLNSDSTNVTQLVFTDFRSGDGKTKNIQIQMTVTDNLSDTRNEYAKSVQLETSVEMRGV